MGLAPLGAHVARRAGEQCRDAPIIINKANGAHAHGRGATGSQGPSFPSPDLSLSLSLSLSLPSLPLMYPTSSL
jgi:hypothetical protein